MELFISILFHTIPIMVGLMLIYFGIIEGLCALHDFFKKSL